MAAMMAAPVAAGLTDLKNFMLCLFLVLTSSFEKRESNPVAAQRANECKW
jgi:hypothetical protein